MTENKEISSIPTKKRKYRRLKKFWRFIRWPLLLLLILYVILVLCNVLFWRTQGQLHDDEDSHLAAIINSIIEIPYFHEFFVIDKPEHIKTLSYEEWMKLKCNPLEYDKFDEIFGGSGSPRLPQDEIWRINCLSTVAVAKIGPNTRPIKKEFCSNYLNCQILSIAVKSYVFDHPEVLWSIMKVAERPCDYIKKFSGPNPLKVKEFSQLSSADEQEIKARSAAEAARHYLCQDKGLFISPRRYVLITVQDLDNKRTVDFIVRRLDIN